MISALITITSFVNLPEGIAQLWLRLLTLCPTLQSEYIQVLVFVVVPLIFFLAVLIVDLKFGHKALTREGHITFRPSYAVRFAWIVGILALLADPFVSTHQNWITITADLLSVVELLRTFPRNLTLGPEGLRWRNMMGPANFMWEEVSCFVKEASPFGPEYKLCSNTGQTFVVSSLVIPGWKQIVRHISENLAQRHLKPNSSVPKSALDIPHRLLMPVCLAVIIVGHHFQR